MRLLLNSFTSGELTPYLYRRADFDQYYTAAKLIKNFIILPYGGLLRVPGTYFTEEVKDSSKSTRLIPFIFSVEQTYQLEFGDQYIRFYMNNGQIDSGGSPYEISSPYTEDELSELQYAQDADVMWIVHPNHRVRKLQRYGHTNWVLSVYNPTNNPFTHSSWAASTAYSVGDIVIPTSANGYYYRCKTAGTSGSSEPSWPTTIGSTVTDGSVTWECYSDTPVKYPAAVTFFEQRIWFGYTKAEPQTIWASKSGDYEDMTTGSNDDDALKYTLGTGEVNVVRWLIGKKVLYIGTSGGIIVAGSNDATSPITSTNIMTHRETNEGCYPLMPVMIGSEIYYVHRDGKKLMEFAYDYTSDTYKAVDISLLAGHLFSQNIDQMAYQQSPYNILWIITGGEVRLFTRNALQKIAGYSRKLTDGDIESISVIPRAVGDYDEVWMIVKRTINGNTKRYVEYVKSYDFGDIEDAFFVDCGLTYNGTATDTITGLSHLEGKTVSILADGAVHPNKTVSSGQITLDWEASKVQVGLAYTSEVESLPIAIPDKFNSLIGRKKRMFKAFIDFYNTVGGKAGVKSYDTIYFRDSSMAMDEAVPLYDGIKEITLPSGWGYTDTIKVKQDQPLPMCIRGIGINVNLGD